MEAYVTQLELEHVLKELRKVQSFLTDTFGSKFTDFRCKDEDLRVDRRLGSESQKLSVANVEHIRDHITIIVDPLEDRVPIVTATQSLQLSGPRAPSSYNNGLNTVVVPILHTNKISITKVPAVTTNLVQNVKESTQSNATCYIQRDQLKSVPVVTNLEEDNGKAPKQGFQAGPPRIHIPPPPPQPIKPQTKKGVFPAVPGEFQLRGRMLFRRPPTPSPSPPSNISIDRLSSNDSVPIPIGIETMEGMGTPPKRVRPAPLPSFRKRSLSLLSSRKPLGMPKTACSSGPTASSENEIIQCDMCNLFIYSSQLDSHMKNHSILDGKSQQNNGENTLMKKIQTCPICSIQCIDFPMYEQHCADSHPQEGFPCPICSRRMSSKCKLKRHMTIHRNLKFECQICGKAYNRNDNLTAHYKTHGNNEQVTVFYCSTCNMAFSSRAGRDKHTATCTHSDNLRARDNDSGENEMNSSSPNATEKIKIDDSAIGLEFEYEGDDDDE